MEQKKLFLLDAYALIYRAYYALVRSPRVTSSGMNTSAVFGFCNTLEDVLRKENPGYIAVCFDPSGGKTFRHEAYPEYKANRDKQPEDITLAIPYIHRILRAMHIPAIEVEHYEADDVIGTLSVTAAKEGFTTYMMTLDKDYGQLVTDTTLMYRPAIKGQGFEVRGPEQVCERYGLESPRQIIDLLALEGDTSDNVPGCPGVGEVTAAKLIRQYGSVENLLEHASEIKGKLGERIRENATQIRQSKDLVTICTDVPLPEDVTPESFRRTEPDIPALMEIFKELEFKSMAAKYAAPASEVPAPPPTSGDDGMGSLFDLAENDQPANVKISARLADVENMAAFLEKASKAGDIGILVHAKGDNAMDAQIKSVSLAFRQGDRIESVSVQADLPGLAQLLEPLFADSGVTIVSEDIKRDMVLLRRMGVTFQGTQFFDTSVAHYVLSPETRHSVDALSPALLGTTPGASKNAADPQVAAERLAAVLRLKPLLEKELRERKQDSLLSDLEFPMIPVLAQMEWNGVRIDPGVLRELSGKLTQQLHSLEKQAYELAGHPFNPSSPTQVGQILFGEMEIDPKAKKTKGGAWSTTEEVLEKYRADYPIVQLILDIRGLRKLLSTYIDALPGMVLADGRIHSTFNQTVTATGRISSTNPNLQNIPIRTPEGREIRRAFVASEGNLILSADYSQIELRLMAHLSNDPAMVGAFLSGADIHTATAAKIYGVEPEKVSDNQRRHAKTANFGIIYGISAFGLSQRLAIARADAKALIEGYKNTYPGVTDYISKVIDRAREEGAVSTVMNRRRYLPDINSRNAVVRGYAERNAVNAPIQGSAADIIKRAMIDIYNEMERRNMQSKMILQIHDELLFDVVPDELADLQTLVSDKMEHAFPGSRVPLEVSSGVATNWLDAH